MGATMPTDGFYQSLPILRDFTRVMDPRLFAPLPGDWMVGVADVMQSTKAIAENRYKAVNMAGAAVIVAITNALANRDFPFVFGGDGASFAVAAEAAVAARQALAETATWVKEDLDLTLRIGMVPVADIRAHGFDVRVARYAPSQNISIAMFAGGGIAWADAAMKRGDIAVAPARPARTPTSPGCHAAMRKSRRRAAWCSHWWSHPHPGQAGMRSAPRSSPSQGSWSERRTRRGRWRPSGRASPGRRPAPTSRRARRAVRASRCACARSRCWRGRCFIF